MNKKDLTKEEKKYYETPILKKYGKLKVLTLAGSGTLPDADTGGGTADSETDGDP